MPHRNAATSIIPVAALDPIRIVIEATNKVAATLQEIQQQAKVAGQQVGQSINQGVSQGADGIASSFQGIIGKLQPVFSQISEAAKAAFSSIQLPTLKVPEIPKLPEIPQPRLNPGEVIEFAKALKISYAEAERLANEIGVTGKTATQALGAMREFDSVKLNVKEQVAILNQQLGLTEKQFNQLSTAAKKVGGEEGGGGKNPLSGLANSARELTGVGGKGITGMAFAFNQVTLAVQGLQAAGAGAFEFLIGANEKLNAQLLSSQANLASSTRIFKGGVEVTDPTEKIKASEGALREALRQIEIDTESLVGVTSEQVNELFQITLTNASELNNQSKQFPDPIRAAGELTKGWAASLQTMGVPLFQARQEINSILKGQIDYNSIVAKNLNIGSAQVKSWKQQGILVDELNKRLETFVAGNALAARSISGQFSNIQDFIQRFGREIGRPLLEPVVAGLESVFKLLKANEKTIFDFGKNAVVAIQSAVGGLLSAFQPVTDAISKVFKNVDFGAGFEQVQAKFKPIIESIQSLANTFGFVLGNIVERYSPIIVQNFAAVGDAALSAASDGIPMLLKAIEVLLSAFDTLSNNPIAQTVFQTLTASVTASYQGIAAIVGVVKDLGDAIGAAFGKIQEVVFPILEGIVNNPAFQAVAKVLGIDIGQALDSLKPKAESASEGLKSLADGFKQVADQATSGGDKLEIQGNTVKDLGSQYEQLEKKASGALATLEKAQGDPAQFQQAAKDVVETTQSLLDMGKISQKEAERRLSEVGNSAKVEIATQKSAQEAIAKIRKDAVDDAVKDSDVRVAQINAQVSAGQVSEIEGIQRVTKEKLSANEIQAKATEEAIKRELELIKRGSGSKEKLEDLKREQGSLQAKRVEIAADAERKIQAERLAQIERANKKALDAITQAEVDRKIQVDQLFRSGSISRQQIRDQENKATLSNIQKELEAEQKKQVELESAPRTGKAEDIERVEAQIRASKIKTSQLTLKLLEEETKQQKQAIDDKFNAFKNSVDQENLAVSRQSQAYSSILKSQDILNGLVKARLGLVQALSEYVQSEFSAAVRLLQTEDERQDRIEKRRQLQEQLSNAETEEERRDASRGLERLDREEQIRAIQLEAARAKYEALLIEQEIERETLAIEERKLELSLQKEQIDLRKAKNDAKAEEAKARAELAKAQIDKNITPEEFEARKIQLEAATDRRLALNDEQVLLEERKALQQVELEAQRLSLDKRQETARDGQRAEIATLTDGIIDDRALSAELLGKARKGRTQQQTEAKGEGFSAIIKEKSESVTGKSGAFADRLEPTAPQALSPDEANPVTAIKEGNSLLSEIRDVLKSSLDPEKLKGQGTVNNQIVNNFTGEADKRTVNDAQQQTLQALRRVLQLAS